MSYEAVINKWSSTSRPLQMTDILLECRATDVSGRYGKLLTCVTLQW